MNKLLALPVELINDIVGRCEHKDVINLCLVCSYMRDIASRWLYRDLTLSCSAQLPEVSPFFLFLRTIFHHPTRTTLVRRIQITGISSGTDGYHAASLWSRDLPLVQRLTSPEEYAESGANLVEYMNSEDSGYLDFMVALLLMTLPNLQSARLNLAFAKFGRCTDMVTSRKLFERCSQPHPLTPWGCLQNLETIDYYIHPSKVLGTPPQPVNLLFWLFYQPKLKSIQIRLVEYENDIRAWPSSPPPRQPSLTSLSLIDSCLRPDSLRHLLRCTPNLRKLKFQYSCDVNTSPDECIFLDCAKLGQALGESCKSLEDLSLSTFFYFYTREPSYGKIYGGDICGIFGSLGPLIHFTKLKHLQ
ncbi:MAG: hypothetical protein Q9224_003661, partial [Gallowayella concinna]